MCRPCPCSDKHLEKRNRKSHWNGFSFCCRCCCQTGIEHCKAHNNDAIKSLHLELPTTNYCQCTIESIVPLYPEAYQTSNPAEINSKSSTTIIATAAIMRDMTSSGTLRGLLKKPNRPPPLQKNRVIFDETRNEFFDADYIILVRDECPYDEEDEEPCTCGEHELVRLCCDEGCQCAAYSDDGRTPQVIHLEVCFLFFSFVFFRFLLQMRRSLSSVKIPICNSCKYK